MIIYDEIIITIVINDRLSINLFNVIEFNTFKYDILLYMLCKFVCVMNEKHSENLLM